MSGRNSRIVRNRDRSKNIIDWNSNNAKIIVGISIAILVVLIIIVIIVGKVKNNNNQKQIESISNSKIYEYFMLSSGENIGVIDKKANTIIDAKYARIDIPNPSKDVFFCYSDDEKYEILNKNAEKIFSDYEKVEAISISNENGEFEKNVLKYKKNNLYGLIDFDGNVLTDAIYQEISSVKDKPGSLLIKKDDKYGVLDSLGNLIIETKYDNISADGYCSKDDLYKKTGYIISEKTKDGVNFGYIDYKGKLVLDVKYESIERALEYDEEDCYLIAMQKGKQGVFKDKKEIIDLKFQDINYSDLSNVFIVNKNGKYGFYNKQGKIILKSEYDNYSIAGNYISVSKNNKKELFDINGNLVNTTSYTKMIETENPAYFIAEDEEGFFSIISKDININEKYIQIQYAFDNYFIFTDETSKMGVVNALTGDIEIKPEYDFIIVVEDAKALQAIKGVENLIDIYSSNLEKTVSMKDAVVEKAKTGYAIIYSETDMKYINNEGKVVENTEVYSDEKLYAVQESGKWGFVDSNKNIVIKCEYDIVTEFNEYGFAGIKKGGKWGVVNDEGKIVVKPTYELDTYYFPQFIGKYLLIQSEIIYCEEGEINV